MHCCCETPADLALPEPVVAQNWRENSLVDDAKVQEDDTYLAGRFGDEIGHSLSDKKAADVSPSDADEQVQSPASVSKSMALELSAGQKLRATCLVQTLEFFGLHFVASSLATTTFTSREADKLFRKSTDTERVHVFISHCWRDGRFTKVLALWIRFNLQGALLCSSFVGLITFVCSIFWSKHREEGELATPWTLITGISTFFVALAYWHYLPSGLGRKTNVFFDKLCVHQSDPALRQQGIDSFAAYIAKSDHILVLWSPEYFTRLWCTLEMAALVKTYSRTSKDLPVYFLPLSLAKAVFFCWISVAVLCYTRQVRMILMDAWMVKNSIFFPVLFLNSLTFGLMIEKYAVGRKCLSEQLVKFDVRAAKCAFESDREKVYCTIRQWFTDLDAFNDSVRRNVRDKVFASLGNEFHFPKVFTLPPMLFSIFSQLDSIAAGDFETYTELKIFTMVADIPRLGSLISTLIVCAYCFGKMRCRWLAFILLVACSCSIQMTLAAGESAIHEGTPSWICAVDVMTQWGVYLFLLKASFMFDACKAMRKMSSLAG
mmetsp:Transcript_46049/g.107604  ORF Transcript_46049/g.107604 Transcript_46049/m.107604 type:complete len:546 (-) Transcript_46049:249-1886(-)